MTSDQIFLVRSSWAEIILHADTVADLFYARLFEIDSSAAQLFAGTDMIGQRAKLMRMLDQVVRALDDADHLVAVAAPLGFAHATYRVEERHFASVGEALLASFATQFGTRFTPELHDAWAEAYTMLASLMLRAITRSRHQQVRA